MSDDEAAQVAVIKLDHLNLAGMTLLSDPRLQRHAVRLEADCEGAMRRSVIFPIGLPAQRRAA